MLCQYDIILYFSQNFYHRVRISLQLLDSQPSYYIVFTVQWQARDLAKTSDRSRFVRSMNMMTNINPQATCTCDHAHVMYKCVQCQLLPHQQNCPDLHGPTCLSTFWTKQYIYLVNVTSETGLATDILPSLCHRQSLTERTPPHVDAGQCAAPERERDQRRALLMD